MASKYTFLFNVVSGSGNTYGQRFGGFSESYLHASDSMTDDDPAVKNLVSQRLSLCSNQVTLVGMRRALLGTVGKSTVFKWPMPGTWSGVPTGDFPSAAIIATGEGGAGQKHTLLLRGLPDEASLGGVTAQNLTSLNTRCAPFFFQLKTGGWYQNVRNLSATSAKIVSISSLGLVTTFDPFVVADNGHVRILRTRSSVTHQPLKGGLFRVTTPLPPNSFVLVGWAGGTAEGGRVRIDGIIPNGYGDLRANGVTTRKVGRPFFQYVGRRATA